MALWVDCGYEMWPLYAEERTLACTSHNEPFESVFSPSTMGLDHMGTADSAHAAGWLMEFDDRLSYGGIGTTLQESL